MASANRLRGHQQLGWSAELQLRPDRGAPAPRLQPAAFRSAGFSPPRGKAEKCVCPLCLPAGVCAYLFQGADGAVAVLSPVPGHALYLVPGAVGLEVRELFGNLLPARAPIVDTMVFLKTAAPAAQLEGVLLGR